MTAVWPTVLIVLAGAGLAVVAFKKVQLPFSVKLLSLAALGMILSISPRFASNRLAFALPFVIPVIGWLVFQQRNKALQQRNKLIERGTIAATVGFILLGAVSLPPVRTREVETAMGVLRCMPTTAKELKQVQQYASPGSTILVYPYAPILYAVTGTDPASYYSFLQPGMMDERDEARVIADCERQRPSLVIWQRLQPDQIRTIWPNTDMARAGFPKLEQYIQSKYRQLPSVAHAGLEFWELR